MELIRLSLDASLLLGTKQHNSAMIKYSGMYVEALRININKFGAKGHGKES